MKNKPIFIIGAGLSGCVLAERIASVLDRKVIMIEKRSHIAGNCYDHTANNGVLVHKYGPHYFRTNSEALLTYLSAFTSWIPGDYIVKSSLKGDLYDFPINLNTLEQFFQCSLDAEGAKSLLEKQRKNIPNPCNSEEWVLSQVGKKLYEAFFLNYTLKQWNQHPRKLDKSVCGRIPVRLNRDNRYVEHRFQLMPANGYTVMASRMISHPNIELKLNTDFREVDFSGSTTIYTGPIDEYFNYCYGKLPWRSLRFEFSPLEKEYSQPCVQVNYPNEHAYTRSVEFKHVTKQTHPHTVVCYEYPSSDGSPYYPVPTNDSQSLYEKYKMLAKKETLWNDVYFTGRLAEYKYLNMDEVIERALNLFELIKSREI